MAWRVWQPPAAQRGGWGGVCVWGFTKYMARPMGYGANMKTSELEKPVTIPMTNSVP